MLIHSILKYFILDQCIETLFDKIHYNFKKPDDKIVNVVRKIYNIYKSVKTREGIYIGDFETFYKEELEMFRYSGSTMYELLCIQLKVMKEKYPEFS